MGEGPAALGAEGHARLPEQTRVCSPALVLPGGRVARRHCRGRGGGAATWMSEAAAGICLLKCFCLCFCWTFRAKPEPRIPWEDRRQAHALQTWERAAGELGARSRPADAGAGGGRAGRPGPSSALRALQTRPVPPESPRLASKLGV